MEKKTKFILIGLGVVAVGTGAYFYFQSQTAKKDAAKAFKDAINSDSLQVPSAPTTSSPVPKPSSGSGFPLKKGSRGTLVKNLQNALIKKYGSGVLPKYGADGGFGSETVNALLSKGLPVVIDEDTFTQIVLGSGASTSSTQSSGSSIDTDIAKNLHMAILQGDFTSAIEQLKKIKDVAGYTSVSDIFKQTRIGLVRKTVVTALLDRFGSASKKKDLNAEFYRIGLKYDGSKWSLSGLSGISQLVTIAPALVWDNTGRTLQVPKATILGDYVDGSNGVTQFETLDGRRLFVKTSSISYHDTAN